MPVTRILHRARSPAELERLVRHPAVDAVAVDARVRDGCVLVHSGRPLGPLPVSIGLGGLRRIPSAASLAPVLAAVEGHAGLDVFLRSGSGDAAADLARELMPSVDRVEVRVTCDAWEVADRLREWLPGAELAYAIRSEAQLLWYLDARDRGLLRETPVMIDHRLLHTSDEVEVIHRRAGRVTAGTTQDIDRAIELAEWGVDAVASDHVVVLNSL